MSGYKQSYQPKKPNFEPEVETFLAQKTLLYNCHYFLVQIDGIPVYRIAIYLITLKSVPHS